MNSKSFQDLITLADGGFWYIASPYSHPNAEVRALRTKIVHQYLSYLLKHGLYVYSPIWAAHEAAVRLALPKDHVWWTGFNTAFMDPAVGLLIAPIDGWEESEGIAAERRHMVSKPSFIIRDPILGIFEPL